MYTCICSYVHQAQCSVCGTCSNFSTHHPNWITLILTHSLIHSHSLTHSLSLSLSPSLPPLHLLFPFRCTHMHVSCKWYWLGTGSLNYLLLSTPSLLLSLLCVWHCQVLDSNNTVRDDTHMKAHWLIFYDKIPSLCMYSVHTRTVEPLYLRTTGNKDTSLVRTLSVVPSTCT